jgi:hypothetical protein
MADSVNDLYRDDQYQSQPKLCAGNGVGFLSTFRRLTGPLKARAKWTKQNEPLRSLGVIAAVGLVIGVAVRLWSSRYA